MRLHEGDSAVDFTVSDIFGQARTLSDYRGNAVLLSFYRYASCPLCNMRIHELIQCFSRFQEKGLYLLAVFQSPKESILGYVAKQQAPFPIIADPERKLYQLYGVETSVLGLMRAMLKPAEFKKALDKGFQPGQTEGAKTQIPADFIINPESIIDTAYYGRDIGDHLPISDIESYLNRSS